MEAGAELVARSRLICGEQHVLTAPALLSVYRSDGLRRTGPLPIAAILPKTGSEVAGVVAACAATGMPFVVRGGGTSQSGGALPRDDGVLIVLSRMRRILAAPHDGPVRQITVEPGVPPSALPSAGAPGDPAGGSASWFAGPEPIGTVGGHLAESPGVVNVDALDLVQADGTLVRLHRRQVGYDLVGAFAGSRGRAGIAVAITLRAVPRR